MKKSQPTSKAKLSSQELRQELSVIAQGLKTSTVSFTKDRILELIDRLGAEPVVKTKKNPSAKPRKRKSKP